MLTPEDAGFAASARAVVPSRHDRHVLRHQLHPPAAPAVVAARARYGLVRGMGGPTRCASRWGGGFGLGSPASLYARSRGTALPSLAGDFTVGGAAGW